MNIGIRLKNLRKEHNVTQLDLAKHLNITRQTISMYEKGLCNIPIEKVKQIAKLFDVTPAYLLGLDQEQPTAEKLEKDSITIITSNFLECDETGRQNIIEYSSFQAMLSKQRNDNKER